LAIKSDEHGTRFFRAVSYQALGDTASAAKDAKIIVQTYLDNGDNESNVLEGALELLWRITTVQEWRNYFREQADHSANDDRAKSAVMYWSQILHREPQNIEAVHKRCSCAVWGKLPSYEAYRYCDTLFRSMPFGSAALDGSLYELRGLQHKLEKRYDKALEDYATALRLRPDNAFTYILRSQTRFAMKQTADSVEQDIRRAVAVAKASAPNDKIIWQKAAEYFRVTNQFDSVVHYISHNIQHDSSDYSALHLRAFAFDELGKREAINDYSRCIALIESLEDKAKLFYENLAEHYSKRGRMKWIFDDSTAEEDFTTSLRIFPTESAFGLRGSWYQARHYYQEALRDYDSVLTRTPQSHDAIFSSAECYYFLKEYSKALQMLRRINLGSDSEISKQARGTVYYLRGVLKSNLGDGAGACMDFHLAAQAGSEEAQATLTKSCSDEEYEEE
jgi:tetratricopeptide (TPR) repeat protein